jgi:hypothetical protein
MRMDQEKSGFFVKSSKIRIFFKSGKNQESSTAARPDIQINPFSSFVKKQRHKTMLKVNVYMQMSAF